MAAVAICRTEAEIRADADGLAAERKRLDEAIGEAQAQQASARATLEELDGREHEVFLGERDRHEHRAARDEAERFLHEAVKAEEGLRAAIPGVEERQASLAEELRLCHLASAHEKLDRALRRRNAASVDFVDRLRQAEKGRAALDRARGDVAAIQSEIAELGGESHVLGPDDLADEPDWSLPAGVTDRLVEIVSAGPHQPAAAAASMRAKKARDDATFLENAVRFEWARETIPAHLVAEFDRRIAKQREAHARSQEELRRDSGGDGRRELEQLQSAAHSGAVLEI
jgi:hypothetical protein